MTWEIVAGMLIAIAGTAAGLALLILALPGTWLFWLAAALFAWWTGFLVVGGWTVLGLFALATAGELLEFYLGVSSAARSRPSWRVLVCTLLGGVVGAMLGAPLLFGLGALPGALLGTFAGAALGVAWEGGAVREMWATGVAAMRGRWRGFLAKLIALCTMGVVFLIALLV